MFVYKAKAARHIRNNNKPIRAECCSLQCTSFILAASEYKSSHWNSQITDIR